MTATARKPELEAPSWTPNAAMFDLGRAMPARVVQQLFAGSKLINALADRPLRVYEPGIGTGRIMLPLAIAHPHWQLFGLDIAPAMLAVLQHKAACENAVNLRAEAGDVTAHTERYDLIVISSLLHIMPEWQTLLRHFAAKNLAPGGMIALLGDSGEMYETAIGMDAQFHDTGECDPLLREFWSRYREARVAEGMTQQRMVEIGSSWDAMNPMPAAELEKLGFTEAEQTRLSWAQRMTVRTMIRIIEERVWSSMFKTEPAVYARIVARLKPYWNGLDPEAVAVSRNNVVLRLFRKEKP